MASKKVKKGKVNRFLCYSGPYEGKSLLLDASNITAPIGTRVTLPFRASGHKGAYFHSGGGGLEWRAM